MRLGLDLDGVVANFMARLLEQYNHMTGENIKLEDIKTFKTTKYLKQPRLFYKIKDAPGFIRSLDPIPGAIEAIELLNEKHEIVFISNATNGPTSGHEKREWLKYHFGHLWDIPKLVLTYHKHLVPAFCLLDDKPKNLEGLEYGTIPLLFDQPYNRKEEKFQRICGWDHFLDWVEKSGA